MRDEYLRHGFEPERVIKTTYGVDGAVPGSGRRFFPLPERTTASPSAAAPAMERLRLLFLGRMEPLKGGDVLIAALPLVASALNRPVELTLGGDGSARDNWKTLSRRVAEGSGQLKITFEGWIRQERMKELCGLSDLLVIPSLWPEPFGRVGPQCGLYELPAVAFAVGGITDWLFEGVNGHLAPGNPGTAQGLAQAIVKCVQNPAAYERLRQGAITVARRFNIEDHVSQLNHLFEQVVSDGNYSPAAG
jgi:glycosyltransferase involved in cell wall biosynthesis